MNAPCTWPRARPSAARAAQGARRQHQDGVQEAEHAIDGDPDQPELDISAALRTVPELMLRFGGHRAAAGFTAGSMPTKEISGKVWRR